MREKKNSNNGENWQLFCSNQIQQRCQKKKESNPRTGWRGDLNFLKLAADMYNVHQLQYVWTMLCVYTCTYTLCT